MNILVNPSIQKNSTTTLVLRETFFNQQSMSRNREEELEIPKSFFQRMHQLHEDWLIHGNSSSKVTAPQVLVINADVDISILSTTYENLAALVWNTLPKELKLNKSTEN